MATKVLNTLTRFAAKHPEGVLAFACIAVGLATALTLAGVSSLVSLVAGAR
jgi:hypothetical protein